MLKNKNIVIGISGGIAVYKVCDIVSRLKKLGANINIIMTKNATNFVSPLTFQSLSNTPVVTDMFEKVDKWDIEHIALAKKADLFLLVPATANIIGKLVSGISDDMLTTTVMATKSDVLIAPAMNTNMYNNKIVQDNILKLKNYGYKFIEPSCGRLACGDIGKGKLADVEVIIKKTVNYFFPQNLLLKDKKVLVTAGPTNESIDPVRYLTNHSSGKMGYEIAKSAIKHGAKVTLISGQVNIPQPENLDNFIQITTANEMFEEVKNHYKNQDIIIKSAAVADYRPEYTPHKIKKKDGDLYLKLKRNPDILSWIGENKQNNQILVGFAAESENLINNAITKLNKKNLDMIVANNIIKSDAGFKKDTNKVTIINKDGTIKDFPVLSKSEVAENIIKIIVKKI